jgi:predicted alpha-1,2-mannosidase
MKRLIIPAFLIFSLLSCKKQENFTKYVDPFLGTGAHGHTFPGAALPFGMVQLSPDNGRNGWDWSSGYHYSDSLIIGFSHTHLSGTGVGDLLDITLQPTNKEAVNDTSKGGADFLRQFISRFNHKDEQARPGYYSILFNTGKIKAELTASARAGFHRYTFTDPQNASVILDLGHAVNYDSPAETRITKVDEYTVKGYRYSHGWAENQWVYFVATFSKPFKSLRLVKDGEILTDQTDLTSRRSSAIFTFNVLNNEPLLIKMGLSSVSEEGANRNLKAEIPHWDFEELMKFANAAWNKQLSKIKITADNTSTYTIFYTALYHSMLAPSLYSDVDGQYRGLDGKIHKTGNFANYYTFSLWDTFRGAHPLFTIMHPKRSSDFINAMLSHYRESKDSLLPVWSLWGNETFCMTGYHSVPVITDAILKELPGFNVEEAYVAMKKSSMENIRNCDLYRKYGYIPFDSANVRSHGQGNESASNTLEYAYDDWCIARVAKKLGKMDEYDYYMKRSEAYKLLLDPQTRLIRPRNANGSWLTPFRPNYAQSGNGFTEGNSWQHSWFVPQDVEGLIKSMGGPEVFTERPDSLFHQPTTESGYIDVSGLIGQYAHGNEPVHHVAYLYNYSGKPEKTQEILSLIVDSLYKTGPEGLCGNDDCGQMSAWYILTALGFYPVNAASGDFDLGRPFLNKAELRLVNGKVFLMEAINLSKRNIHVSKVSLNGKEIKDWKINYKDIMAGGKLIFELKE